VTRTLAALVPLLVPIVAFAGPPAAAKKPVTDTYHGVAVSDDYRWLEDGSGKDVKAWSAAQNSYARALLGKLPGTKTLRAELKKILTAKRVSHSALAVRGGRLFALRTEPPREQPLLVVMPSYRRPDRARVLVDPGAIDRKGTTTIDWFEPSPDGKLVAVSLSRDGSEAGDVHVYETATGKQVHEVIPRVHGGTAGGDLAWAPDGKGFYYTRYPRGKERPPGDLNFYQQLYYHELGTPTEKDRSELGKGLPRVAEIRCEMHHPSGTLLVAVQDGDSGRFAHYLRSRDGTWQQLSAFGDGVVQAAFGPAGDLYLVSRKGAPRGKVLRLSAGETDLGKAALFVPEGKETIVTDPYRMFGGPTVLPMRNRLYALYQVGGPMEVRAFDAAGKPVRGPEQLPVGTASGLALLGGDDVLFVNESYLEPPQVYAHHASRGTTVKTSLNTAPPVSFADVKVFRELARSKDGTRVPLTILVPRGAKKGGPCLATGYGGFGLSQLPQFRPELRVLFDRGVAYAAANLRGGGEYGEEWHRAGNLTNKQNVFDDFAAVLRHLSKRKYTRPGRLGIIGGSNGGLLMGAALTQHPGLVRAVVSHVGIYDMLRVERTPNGAFNIPEYGTVKDEAQFKALYAYSPYHRVKDGERYPAVLFLTGANDPRVDPLHSRKMTARLQAATRGPGPILLRTSETSGHGLGTGLSEKVDEKVDVFAFLLAQLGVRVK
jgi:prolyl oligopeptidase